MVVVAAAAAAAAAVAVQELVVVVVVAAVDIVRVVVAPTHTDTPAVELEPIAAFAFVELVPWLDSEVVVTLAAGAAAVPIAYSLSLVKRQSSNPSSVFTSLY